MHLGTALLVTLVASLCGCAGKARQAIVPPGPIWITLRHGQTEERSFVQLIAEFEAAHPNIRVRRQVVSAEPDGLHQLYLTALEGGADDFDLFRIDVVWTA